MADDCGCGCDDCNDKTIIKNTGQPIAVGRSKLVRLYKAQTSYVASAIKKIVNESLNPKQNG